MQKSSKHILFIVQYPEKVSPGQRFRIELYKDLLKQNGFSITTHYFLNTSGYNIIHKPEHFLLKVAAVLRGFIKRTLLAFRIKKYDYIFLQREAAPVGPPFFEWLYIKVLKCKLIYDFDDAIWISQPSRIKNNIPDFLRNTSKVKKICKWAYKVSCGNEFLCAFARSYNSKVVYNPTCVDTDKRHNTMVNHNTGRITVGWTGSFSTLIYLEDLVPVLKRLQDKYDFDVMVICNEKPWFELKNLVYIDWTEETEVEELAKCHIGLMPLRQDVWSEGKCGFKLIQYLSLGMPAVSSSVGVNKIIIDNNENGFLCETENDWYNAIEKLINDASLRKKMGEKGREKILAKYSLKSNKENFLSLFS